MIDDDDDMRTHTTDSCMEIGCKQTFPPQAVRDICGQELFAKWEDFALKVCTEQVSQAR